MEVHFDEHPAKHSLYRPDPGLRDDADVPWVVVEGEMNLVFYILIYLTAPCWNNCMLYTLPTSDMTTIGGGCYQCAKISSAEMKVVDSINDILERKNKALRIKPLFIDYRDPDHIYKVTVENGKFSQKEIKIVPVIKKTKFTIEQEKETIEGYKVE